MTDSSEIRRINLSRIPKEKRAQAWEKLKKKYPDQAAWVQDPIVQAIRDRFNAELIIDLPAGKD